MVREHTLTTCHHTAVNMARAGMKVGDGARQLCICRRTLHLSLARDRSVVSLENRKGHGWFTVLNRVAKIVLTMAVLKALPIYQEI